MSGGLCRDCIAAQLNDLIKKKIHPHIDSTTINLGVLGDIVDLK